MKLDANACNDQISKFYMRVITHTLHVLYPNTKHRLHTFYVCVQL